MNDNKNNNQRKLSRGMSFLYGMKPKKQEEKNNDLSNEHENEQGVTMGDDASSYATFDGGDGLRGRKSVLQDDFEEQNTYEDATEEDFKPSNQVNLNQNGDYETINEDDEDEDEDEDEGDDEDLEELENEESQESNEEDDFIEAEELNEEEEIGEGESEDEDNEEDNQESEEDDECEEDEEVAEDESEDEDGEYDEEDLEDYTALDDEDEDDESLENTNNLQDNESLNDAQSISTKHFAATNNAEQVADSTSNNGQKMSLSQRIASEQVAADEFDIKSGNLASGGDLNFKVPELSLSAKFNQQDNVIHDDEDIVGEIKKEENVSSEHEETVLDGDIDIDNAESEEIYDEDLQEDENENEDEDGDGDGDEAEDISDDEAINFDSNGLAFVPIELIHPNPDQPRKDFNDAELAELAHSIAEKGILQPIILLEVVDAQKQKTYQIIAGERRYRASQLAGINVMPAIIKTHLSENELFEISIIENLQRSALNPVEEASAYYNLTAKYDYTQEQVAHAVGKTRSYIANMLRLLNLPHAVKLYLKSGELTTGHGKVLAGLPNAAMLADIAVKKQLSVRDLEKLVKTTRLQEMQDHIGNLKSANDIRPEIKTNLQNYVSKLKQHGVDAAFKFNAKSGNYDFIIKTKEVHLLLEMLSLLDVADN